MSFRVDKDSLGKIKVPSSAYYGPFTVRAIEQYKVTGQKSHTNLVRAYVMIKRSAALANSELKALEQQKARAIIKACDEILSGKMLDSSLLRLSMRAPAPHSTCRATRSLQTGRWRSLVRK